MERHYEKPAAQVVRYRKRVKTDTEKFTDSGGVQQVGFRCPYCRALVYTLSLDQFEDIKNLDPAIEASCEAATFAHCQKCPKWPSNIPRPTMPPVSPSPRN